MLEGYDTVMVCGCCWWWESCHCSGYMVWNVIRVMLKLGVFCINIVIGAVVVAVFVTVTNASGIFVLYFLLHLNNN